MAMRKHIAIGSQIGWWTVLGPGDVIKIGKKCPQQRSRLLVQCACGTVKNILPIQLRSGQTLSCGCMQPILSSEKRTVHGHTVNGKSHVYQIWAGMLSRCKNKSLEYYGGRGISVSARWLKFENFLADMGEPIAGLTLDRIDNDGGYDPSNVRWASREEQSRNRRNNVWVDTSRGRMLQIDIARIAGVSQSVMDRRMKRGWTGERLFSPPDKRYQRRQNAGPHPAAS